MPSASASGKSVEIAGTESNACWLVNTEQCARLFGPPRVAPGDDDRLGGRLGDARPAQPRQTDRLWTAETDPSEAAQSRLHALTPADAGRGAALSAEIGWNQVESDWRYMLANGTGFGRTAAGGKLVASAMALPYDGFAWVCMVLVAPDQRGRGIATDLMRRVLDDLAERGVMARPRRHAGAGARFTSTSASRTSTGSNACGRSGWRRSGVAGAPPAFGIRGDTPRWAPGGGEETPASIAPMAAADIDEVAAYDSERFGADRRALLDHLRGRAPNSAFVARARGRVAGFVMARDGRVATQVGPVVAEDAATAIALARHAVGGIAGNAVIDACDYQTPFVEWFKGSGFEFQRPYGRMLVGRAQPIDRKENIFAPAGPEFG